MPKHTTSQVYLKCISATSSTLLFAVLLIVCVTASARAWLSPAADIEPSIAPISAHSNTTSQRLEGERITITPSGFEPPELTRPAGRFLLMVDNRSGLEQMTLRLAIDGNTIREKRLESGVPNWSEVLDIPPGQYTITEADHPDWLFRLNITNP